MTRWESLDNLSKHMRVLLLDDSKEPVSALSQAFRGQGFETEVCTTAAETMRRALEKQHDLLIVDGVTPPADVAQLCRVLRGAGVSVAMIVLSHHQETQKRIDILDAGADDHLLKPVDFAELLARARAILRRCGVTLEKIHVGSLIIDPRSRYVVVEGRSVEMTDREAALLAFLAIRAGSVVSRDEIIKHVWKSVVPASNTIDVNIRHLRDKLGNGAQHLKTVRGRGYMLQD